MLFGRWPNGPARRLNVHAQIHNKTSHFSAQKKGKNEGLQEGECLSFAFALFIKSSSRHAISSKVKGSLHWMNL